MKQAEGLEFPAMVESVVVRGLPVSEAKEDLVKSLEIVTNAADELLAAMEAKLGVGKAQGKVKFDQPQEYTSAMEMKGRLHLMLSAKLEYNSRSKQPVVTQGSSFTKPAPIKIKLPAVKFSGLPRDFACFKKEFQEIALLRDAVPEKHKHLLRNLDLSNHREAMTI